MKLIEIINNQTNYTAIADTILSSCKPFLTQIGQNHMKDLIMYRGVDIPDRYSTIFVLPGYRDNRKPKDTPPAVHNAINTVFKKRFGLPFRNSTFVTGCAADTREYGANTYAIIPIGDFKYIWSPTIKDLFVHLKMYLKLEIRAEDPSIYSKNNSLVNNTLVNYVNTQKFVELYQDTNLRAAILSNNEVMIYCDSCYYISEEVYYKILKIIMAKRAVANSAT